MSFSKLAQLKKIKSFHSPESQQKFESLTSIKNLLIVFDNIVFSFKALARLKCDSLIDI